MAAWISRSLLRSTCARLSGSPAAPWAALGVRSNKASSRTVPVIMVQDVQAVGFKGEELKVKPGFARNYLIPQKLSVYATLENREKYAQEKSAEQENEQEEKKRMAAINRRMSKIKVTFKRHSTDGETLYGSVSAKNIVQALAKQDVMIQESKVKLPEPIKALGEHQVPVTLDTGDDFVLNVTIVKR